METVTTSGHHFWCCSCRSTFIFVVRPDASVTTVIISLGLFAGVALSLRNLFNYFVTIVVPVKVFGVAPTGTFIFVVRPEASVTTSVIISGVVLAGVAVVIGTSILVVLPDESVTTSVIISGVVVSVFGAVNFVTISVTIVVPAGDLGVVFTGTFISVVLPDESVTISVTIVVPVKGFLGSPFRGICHLFVTIEFLSGILGVVFTGTFIFVVRPDASVTTSVIISGVVLAGVAVLTGTLILVVLPDESVTTFVIISGVVLSKVFRVVLTGTFILVVLPDESVKFFRQFYCCSCQGFWSRLYSSWGPKGFGVVFTGTFIFVVRPDASVTTSVIISGVVLAGVAVLTGTLILVVLPDESVTILSSFLGLYFRF
ncbi:hypothetical protein TNIN_333691 [Trichonephila inaurata madagascariensis]|uniref:Uncharacterized protein n=1 Tax=Trichonephila inaurata madagascariensis TaxID=2747483 RepID=A0A8X6MMF8_9ARAC|nr:hypothetical protein TNIN_333691 [Trichonephila inaurata madagascariensis]